MGVRTFLSQIFTWWNGQTVGTRFFTWRKGIRVGEDMFGNVYFQERGGKRRWVIYNGICEASRVPPKWNAWLQKRRADPPLASENASPSFLKAYTGNLTGTDQAFKPNLHERKPRQKLQAVHQGYTAWSPENPSL